MSETDVGLARRFQGGCFIWEKGLAQSCWPLSDRWPLQIEDMARERHVLEACVGEMNTRGREVARWLAANEAKSPTGPPPLQRLDCRPCRPAVHHSDRHQVMVLEHSATASDWSWGAQSPLRRDPSPSCNVRPSC